MLAAVAMVLLSVLGAVQTDLPPAPQPTLLRADDGPDPSVVVSDEGTFLYTTNTAGMHVPVTDLATGERREALPALPGWSASGQLWGLVWAPNVTQVGSRWVMWYVTHDAASGHQCISVATADHPLGPFVDATAAPTICSIDDGGAIDPSVFNAPDDSRWLLFKIDGNCCGLPTSIQSVRLSDDATTVVGEPAVLLRADQEWEQGIVEGPSMQLVDGGYVLLYSGANWVDSSYGIGIAICAGPQGPCMKPLAGPLQGSRGVLIGPGGTEFVSTPKGTQVVFHAWEPIRPGFRYGGRRQTWLVEWDTWAHELDERWQAVASA